MDNIPETVNLIECPRDAMQGWRQFIPTSQKIEYINKLLTVGFDTIDFGSFVSASAIPQMADTKEVLKGLNIAGTKSKLLAIIANLRGAEDAAAYEQIDFLGFPFSISPTFQKRNTNSSIEESFERVRAIQNVCKSSGKQLVIYISMAFGNPYGDEYNEDIMMHWTNKIIELGVNIISVADTVGLATGQQVGQVVSRLILNYPDTAIGVHLHSRPSNWKEKVDAALAAGCRRFDGAIKGIGGCPMANDELIGNMNTELMADYFKTKGLIKKLNFDALAECSLMADKIFGLANS